MKTQDILILGAIGIAGYFLVSKQALPDDGGETGGFNFSLPQLSEGLPQFIYQYLPQPSTGTLQDTSFLEKALAVISGLKDQVTGLTGKVGILQEDIGLLKLPSSANIEDLVPDIVDKAISKLTDLIPKGLPELPELFGGNGKKDDRDFWEKLFNLPDSELSIWARWSEFISGWQDDVFTPTQRLQSKQKYEAPNYQRINKTALGIDRFGDKLLELSGSKYAKSRLVYFGGKYVPAAEAPSYAYTAEELAYFSGYHQYE